MEGMVFSNSYIKYVYRLILNFRLPRPSPPGGEMERGYSVRGSVIHPVTAAAAAVSGLARSVREPGP